MSKLVQGTITDGQYKKMIKLKQYGLIDRYSDVVKQGVMRVLMQHEREGDFRYIERKENHGREHKDDQGNED